MKRIIVFLVISMFVLGINLWQKTDFHVHSMSISNLEILYFLYSISLIFMVLSNIVLFHKKTKNKTTVILNIFCIISTLMTLFWTNKITLISGYTVLLIFSFVCSAISLVSLYNYIDSISRKAYKTNVIIYYILMISFMVFFIFMN